MLCPRCRQDNPRDQKFCGECGTRLAAVCPSCGTLTSPGKNFCGEFGAPAGPATGGRFPSTDAYTPRHLAEKVLTSRAGVEGERKKVTGLFADVKGSMELLADRDPEEARRLLDPVLEMMMEAVHRYEGTVNQVMGDGIMALFGDPLAHEDHAVRACYAALRRQETIKRQEDGAERGSGRHIQVRIGLNSGESSSARSAPTFAWITPRSARPRIWRPAWSRWRRRAPSWRRPRRCASPRATAVEVFPLGPKPVKGIESPVEVYVVTSTAEDRRDRYVTTLDLARALNKAAFGEVHTSTFFDRYGNWAAIRSSLFWILGSVTLLLASFWMFAGGGNIPFLSVAPTPTESLPPSPTTIPPTETFTAIPPIVTATTQPTSTPQPIATVPGGAGQIALLSRNETTS